MLELNDTVWATVGVSQIQGIGIIAIRNIPKGTRFVDVPAPYYRLTDEFHLLHESIQEELLKRNLCIARKENYIPHPNSLIRLQNYMNHSDNPNTDGQMTLRDISKGEELTENYIAITKHHKSGLHELVKQYHSYL